jgi:hypothetical protein
MGKEVLQRREGDKCNKGTTENKNGEEEQDMEEIIFLVIFDRS